MPERGRCFSSSMRQIPRARWILYLYSRVFIPVPLGCTQTLRHRHFWRREVRFFCCCCCCARRRWETDRTPTPDLRRARGRDIVREPRGRATEKLRGGVGARMSALVRVGADPSVWLMTSLGRLAGARAWDRKSSLRIIMAKMIGQISSPESAILINYCIISQQSVLEFNGFTARVDYLE